MLLQYAYYFILLTLGCRLVIVLTTQLFDIAIFLVSIKCLVFNTVKKNILACSSGAYQSKQIMLHHSKAQKTLPELSSAERFHHFCTFPSVVRDHKTLSTQTSCLFKVKIIIVTKTSSVFASNKR